jgi:putative tricarboxylic transport membrane protein
MRINDAVFGVFFVVFAVCIFVYAGTFHAARSVSFGPDLFPRIIAVMMGIGGTILIIGALQPAGRQPLLQLADWARKSRSYTVLAAVAGSMVFYILASGTLGFLLSTFIMMTGLLLVTRGRGSLVSSLVVAVIVSVTIHLIFVRMLRVPLPFGFIESLLVR